MLLDVSVLSPAQVIFEGKARSIVLPGEQGVLEILPFHKRILTRLVSGKLLIAEKQSFPIKRGIARVNQNKVTIIIEK